MSPDDVVEFLRDARACAILRADDTALARGAMAAAIRGGFRVVEFTMTTPAVLELIGELAGRRDLIVGAGTIMSPADARAAVDAGARFLVSPVVDAAVIAEAAALGVAMMPGTYSPTEMWQAHRAGAQLQKLFPAPASGPAHVRSVLGPMPFLRIVPTNGVDETNARAYLDAGAHAVGFVATLFRAHDLAERAFDRVEARARELLDAVA